MRTKTLHDKCRLLLAVHFSFDHLLVLKTIPGVFFQISCAMNKVSQGIQSVIRYYAGNQRMKELSFITEAEADLISTSSMHLLYGA